MGLGRKRCGNKPVVILSFFPQDSLSAKDLTICHPEPSSVGLFECEGS
jgi:hypothetical protein